MKGEYFLIYHPDVNPNTFVLFHRQSARDSWSIRDFSQPGNPKALYAKDFPNLTPRSVRIGAIHWITVEPEELEGAIDHPIYWHRRTLALNQQYLGHS